jgi:hypothetical protein
VRSRVEVAKSRRGSAGCPLAVAGRAVPHPKSLAAKTARPASARPNASAVLWGNIGVNHRLDFTAPARGRAGFGRSPSSHARLTRPAVAERHDLGRNPAFPHAPADYQMCGALQSTATKRASPPISLSGAFSMSNPTFTSDNIGTCSCAGAPACCSANGGRCSISKPSAPTASSALSCEPRSEKKVNPIEERCTSVDRCRTGRRRG